MYERLHIISQEDYEKWDAARRQREESHEKFEEYFVTATKSRNEKLAAVSQKFPFTVLTEGGYYDHDFAEKWCWDNVGAKDGPCQEGEMSDWAGCPQVVATSHMIRGWYRRQSGEIVNWTERAYKDVPEHSHQGNWCYVWLGKTGYDYGISAMCFQNESDRDRFAAAVPTFTNLQQLEQEREGMSTETVCPAGVFQSRFGFHPCSKETSKKLRFLNGVHAKALHLEAAWERWNRKAPWNRIQKRYIRDEKGVKIGKEIVLDANGKPAEWKEPQLCPFFDREDAQMILAASRQARMPQPTPEQVQPLLFSDEEIDRLYEVAKNWLENR